MTDFEPPDASYIARRVTTQALLGLSNRAAGGTWDLIELTEGHFETEMVIEVAHLIQSAEPATTLEGGARNPAGLPWRPKVNRIRITLRAD